MAKLTALDAFTPVLTDILYGVDDPDGTPASGKITFTALKTLLTAGEVALSGSPVAAQLAFWFDGATIQGDSGLTYDGANLTLAGDLAVDTNVLFVNAATNRVGVGLIAPLAKLNVLEITEQLRLSNTVLSFASFTVDSAGDLTIAPSSEAMAITGDLAISAALNVDNSLLSVRDSLSAVGIGVFAPAAKLHILETTEQLRLAFDASNTASFTVDSSGDLTIDASGGALTVGANVTVGGSLTTTGQLEGSLAITTFTGTALTAALSHRSAQVTMDNAAANVYTIPTNATVGLAAGSVIRVAQTGAGTTTITAASGVILNDEIAGSGAMTGQYGNVTLVQLSINDWLVTGDIGTVA